VHGPTVRSFDSNSYRFLMRLTVSTKSPRFALCSNAFVTISPLSSDILLFGMPPPYAAGDFAARFDAYIGGHWYTIDAHKNIPRIGRVLIAQGRDAANVLNTFS
jgi:hypothetical protein